MADYTFDTSGDMSDALKITLVKEQTQAMITPSAEETAERHEAEAQEAAANDEKIGEIIASGRPVMRKIPDLLTTPTITGNLNPPEPQSQNGRRPLNGSSIRPATFGAIFSTKMRRYSRMPIPMPLCSACRRSIW